MLEQNLVIERSMDMSEISFEELKAKYQTLVREHNNLIEEHNQLVENHNKIAEDANCLLRFMEDLSKGIAVFVTGVWGIALGPRAGIELRTPPGVILDEGRAFCQEFHNEIIRFMTDMKKGKRAKEVYDTWIKHCIEVSNGNG